MQVHNKEISYFDNAKRIYPALVTSMGKYDYWIRRKSLISTTGILLLVLGCISVFWSYVIISFYHFQNYYENCDIKIQRMLGVHSIFILAGNIPLIIILLTLLVMKLGSAGAAFFCPDLLVSVSKFCNSEKPKIQIKKYNE